MSRFADVGRWIGVLCCCLTVFGHSRTFSASAPVGGQDAAVVFVFKETGEKRTHEGDQVGAIAGEQGLDPACQLDLLFRLQQRDFVDVGQIGDQSVVSHGPFRLRIGQAG